MRLRRLPTVALVFLALAFVHAAQPDAWLGPPRQIAKGIEYFTSRDSTVVEPVDVVAMYLLRLDPSRVRLDSVLSNDEVFGAETVDGIANRHHAVAAVNGGFFNTKNGEPIGLAKVAGQLVSDTPITKGAVAIRSSAGGRTDLEFDQVAASVAMTFRTPAGREWRVPIDGVDTTRERGKLMLYNHAYHADTDTAGNGTEWVLDGTPLTVREIHVDQGHTRIPVSGIVLSFGGLELPEALAALKPGVTVALATNWKTVHGLPADHLDRADHVVNGAGLLRLKGREESDWIAAEKLNPATFLDVKHPRTLIGLSRDGHIWLAVIDGRQPGYSMGMNFKDLERLCDRLQLTDALNLDGGGSSTMVIDGKIVNRPSDVTGPRPVSDAILVTVR